jgi:hypothetical protein
MRRVDQADGTDLDPNHELGSNARGGGKGGFRGGEVPRQRARARPRASRRVVCDCTLGQGGTDQLPELHSIHRGKVVKIEKCGATWRDVARRGATWRNVAQRGAVA